MWEQGWPGGYAPPFLGSDNFEGTPGADLIIFSVLAPTSERAFSRHPARQASAFAHKAHTPPLFIPSRSSSLLKKE